MGLTAENIAEKCNIYRQEQDELGMMNHQRARKAIIEGKFAEKNVLVEVLQRKGGLVIFDTDERPKDTSVENTAKLQTVFKKGGTVTAGNASGINHAVAAVIVMSGEKAKGLGIKPLAKIVSYASGAVDPAYMRLGPIPEVNKTLSLAGMKISDIDSTEVNEAFTSQAIACIRELGLSLDNTNVNGSGISFYPIGCTDTRVIVTMLYEMIRQYLKTGLATMCIGRGHGMAMIIERL